MPKQVTDEAPPAPGDVRVGIEVEGVGTISTKWDVVPNVSAGDFHDVFKRMKLVRSNSFTSARGVYITPEDADTFGKQSPAELVSSPHLFTPRNLVFLRNSVWKALSPKGMRTGNDSFVDPRVAPPAPQAPTAISRWGAYAPKQIGGSLQTTIGVSTAKLLSDTAADRNAVIGLLVGDHKKADLAKDLLAAAVAAEGFLTQTGNPLAAFVAKKLGIRLAVFFWLADSFGASITAKGQWTKESLGANFKGFSSFVGCGVAVNNNILKLGLAGTVGTSAQAKATFAGQLVQAIQAVTGKTWITDGLSASIDLDTLGQAGHAFQTSCEGWFAIPNFTAKGNLYTVVECREKAALLNMKMVAFLNQQGAGGAMSAKVVEPNSSGWKAALTQASAFHASVAGVIGA